MRLARAKVYILSCVNYVNQSSGCAAACLARRDSELGNFITNRNDEVALATYAASVLVLRGTDADSGVVGTCMFLIATGALVTLGITVGVSHESQIYKAAFQGPHSRTLAPRSSLPSLLKA